MTPHTNRRPARERVFVLPVGLLATVVLGVIAVLVLVGVIASGAIGRAAGGTVVADAGAVAVQRSTAERDLEVGYEAAADQVRKVRALKLAISVQQADTLANKALTDLATLRHSALVSIAQQLGRTADVAEGEARSTEQLLDAKRGQPQASVTPVLLAPRLYAIVARFNDLATQITDRATADLTQSQPAPPSASASPRPSPTASPSPTR